jgi:hypothetical protein
MKFDSPSKQISVAYFVGREVLVNIHAARQYVLRRLQRIAFISLDLLRVNLRSSVKRASKTLELEAGLHKRVGFGVHIVIDNVGRCAIKHANNTSPLDHLCQLHHEVSHLCPRGEE